MADSNHSESNCARLAPPETTLVIRNGLLVDGAGSPSVRADLSASTSEGKITRIGDIPHEESHLVIDASDCIVCPGFIDIHTHSDFFSLIDPRSLSKLLDGVTTELSGHCGSSPFPMRGLILNNRIEGFEKFGLKIDWQDAEGFFKRAEGAGSAINRGYLVGQGTVRGCVMGFDNREPTHQELEEMKSEVRYALDHGALGLSTGLIYPPGCYTKSNEISALCEIVKDHDGLYASHIRSEGEHLEAAIDEILSVSRNTGVRAEIAHLKTSGKSNWRKIETLKDKLFSAREEGVDFSCDRYPYIASSTGLDSILPAWTYEGGNEKELERLADPDVRNAIAKEIQSRAQAEEYWDRIMVASMYSDEGKTFEGKTIGQIAAELSKSPTDTVFDLLIQERLRIGIVAFNMSEDNLKEILTWPFVMIGSDASFRATDGPLHDGKPHPRAYGSFARVLGKYVRTEELLKLETAISKMTSLPARRIGLADRGVLKEGYWADIVVFSPDEIQDRATYEEPHQYSTGIKYVIVNGQIAVSDGKPTGTVSGRILGKK